MAKSWAKHCDECGCLVGYVFVTKTVEGKILCGECDLKEAHAKASARIEAKKRVDLAIEQMIVTTTHKVDGYYAVKYLGIETVECVIGTGVFSEASSTLSDFFGGRSEAFESKLRDAKNLVLKGLKRLAAQAGANAVIGVDIDYTEFSNNRIGVIANGTLVKLKPIRRDQNIEA